LEACCEDKRFGFTGKKECCFEGMITVRILQIADTRFLRNDDTATGLSLNLPAIKSD